MMLSNAGADLFGPNEQRILNILGSTKGGLHVRQIERVAGTPHFTTGGILRRLAKSGLLEEQQIGTSLVYTINREHVLWPAIELALGARDQILNRIREITTHLADQGVTIALYGPAARGDADTDSTIDIAIIYPDELDYALIRDAINRLTNEIEPLTGNPVEVYNIDIATLREMIAVEEEMLTIWEAEAETLAGPDIRDVIKTTSQTKKKKPVTAK